MELKDYKALGCNQYVLPQGYHVEYEGINLGRIIWAKPYELDYYKIVKDGD